MLESYLFDAERKTSFLRVLIVCFLITIVVGFLNQFISNNSLFLVALVSLALSYPIVNYIRSMDKDELEKQMTSGLLFMRHEKEMIVFWALFLGVTIGIFFCAFLGWTTDFTYQDKFVNSVSGKFLDGDNSLAVILINNLTVAFFTMLISLVVFSGLIFVLVWNASIFAYFLYSLKVMHGTFYEALFILPHGLLEIGGFVFAGIAGSLLAHKIDRKNRFEHEIDSEFWKDLAVLIFGSIFLIILGAMIEVM